MLTVSYDTVMDHKEFLSRCGKASAKKLTPTQRKERARKAALARWKDRKPKRKT